MQDAIKAMGMAINALEPWVPHRVLGDIRRRWVRLERLVYELQAEVEALRAAQGDVGSGDD